jgi:hypothetical protein
MREENRQLEEAAVAAEAERAETTKPRKIPVPKKLKTQKGPSYAMGDIIAYLGKMPEVDDADEYYLSAQVSHPCPDERGLHLQLLYRDS